MTLTVNAEFWNRRRYPVVVRQLSVRVGGIDLIPENHHGEQADGMRRYGSRFWREFDQVVEPGGHLLLPVTVEIADQSLDAARPLFDLSLSLTDPVKGGFSNRRLKYRFFDGALGWKLSKKEREAAVLAHETRRHAHPESAPVAASA